MPHVLIATDADWIRDEVESALEAPGTTFVVCRSGQAVTPVVTANPPDLAVLDLQIGNMGGIAVCMNLRLDESGGRLPHIPVLILLDRAADLHLARRAGAEGWLIKPLDTLRLRRAASTILAGGTIFEGLPTPPVDEPVDQADEPVPTGADQDSPRGDEVPTG